MSEPGPGGRGNVPAGTSRYTWIVGVLALVAIAYIMLNKLRTDAPGSRGVADGDPLPPFAVPLATSKLEGDAQVDPKKACDVRGDDILNSCQLAERGPVVLAFFATRSARCERQVDVLERVRRRYPDVGFAAVSVRGDRGDVRRLVRQRHWGMPVGYDHDGAVSNAYAVAICPTITFARRGGEVVDTSFSLLEAGELAQRVEALR
jgi:hypothetical protein